MTTTAVSTHTMEMPPVSEPKAPDHDTELALTFLREYAAKGPWPLVAISPEGGKPIANTFTPDTVDFCRSWIEANQGAKNIYFMVNPPTSMLTKKAKKSDVAAMAWLHVDADPAPGKDFAGERKRILKELQDFQPKPTVIIDSGGGYQAFWRLDAPVPVNGDEQTCAEFETYNRQLELLLSGDKCHNLDRIMRLPGTINLPNDIKRAKGRQKALATTIHFKSDLIYRLEEFCSAPNETARGGAIRGQQGKGGATVTLSEKLPHIEDLEALPLSDTTKALILTGSDPDDPARWADRSRLVYHVLCEMVRAGIENDVMASIITDPTYRVSAHVLDHKGDTLIYAARQIEQAREEVEADIERHFIQTEKGMIRKDLPENIEIALNQLRIRLSFDEFAGRELIRFNNDQEQLLTDASVNDVWYSINCHFGRTAGYTPDPARVERVMGVVARRNGFHPVRDYFDRLQWDGVPRIDT